MVSNESYALSIIAKFVRGVEDVGHKDSINNQSVQYSLDIIIHLGFQTIVNIVSNDSVLEQLTAQVAQQQQLLEQLLAQQVSLLEQPRLDNIVSITSHIHTLPVRPHFDWIPLEASLDHVPEFSTDLFSQVLSDDQKKSIIEFYPPMQTVKYSPPLTIPVDQARFNKSQSREDQLLKNIQYQLSAVFRPLDVLANELYSILPPKYAARVFTILRDTRTLLMHANGTTDQARNSLALKAINPSFTVSPTEGSYTITPDTFQTLVSQCSATQKFLREARSRFHRTNSHSTQNSH
ncbi:hypothetical protein DFQ28_008974 [Apophysomyces sp. BC1034]|nr:hypothetical protein DFQ30_001593 [Apophysomyces sp. BC1015]KAG0180384.1 hypothetical protein DFQ29_000779 [Apophysomyces sp. BC1021]KAG0192475.1 hypothetical protein DFQ28_008974 [Apophysomyces sp. BC1034]